ncbi:MAG: SpoIIE family protein phosphatase [Methanobacterium sp.]|nr:SpoIIE family protein phosphatase [Methanobacterium sp.]
MKQNPQEELKDSLIKIRSFLIPGDDEDKVMYLHAVVALLGSLCAFFLLEYGEMSLGMMEHTFLILIEKTCVIVVIAYIISRMSFFKGILQKKFTIRNQILMIAAFGAISVFGTYSGINIMGAIANVRDLAPMIAGLVGGPWIGLGVGLIGGVHRFFLGGPTAIACGLATILAGLFGGLIYVINKGKFIGIIGAVIFAALMESFHMILNLLITKPYSLAFTIVQDLAGPMILANSLGMLVFAFIISNLLKEQKTKQERDQYLDELERHKYELQVAQKIQKSFLPNNIPSMKRLDISAINLPAKDAGGDFYDFITLSDEKIAVVIADVSDRKVPATLLMAVSRTIIRSISESALNPKSSQLVEYLNRLITEKSKSDVSLTLFYGILNMENKEMNFINAGHSPPLVFKSKDKKIISLEKTDVLLGVNKNIKLEDKKLSLEKDDIIIFHTDGIYSVTNVNGEHFNNDLIGEILIKNSPKTSKEIINDLKDSIRGFCGKGVLEDDISLIVLKVK